MGVSIISKTYSVASTSVAPGPAPPGEPYYITTYKISLKLLWFYSGIGNPKAQPTKEMLKDNPFLKGSLTPKEILVAMERRGITAELAPVSTIFEICFSLKF